MAARTVAVDVPADHIGDARGLKVIVHVAVEAGEDECNGSRHAVTRSVRPARTPVASTWSSASSVEDQLMHVRGRA